MSTTAYDGFSSPGEVLPPPIRKNEVQSVMEYRIVAKQFDDQTVALLYANRHLCVATMNGCVIENRNADGEPVDYSVLELVSVSA